MSTDREREALARLTDDRRFRNDILNAIAGAQTEAMRGGCLAVALCSEFEKHPDCPEDGEMDDTDCWKQWAVDRTTEVLECVAVRVLSLPPRAAGWMPRPEPGSPDWEAMVERAARAIGIRLGYEGRLLDAYMPEGRLLALAALRAALGTGGAGGE